MRGPQINGHGKSLLSTIDHRLIGGVANAGISAAPSRCDVNLKTTAKEELLKLAQSIEHDLAAARAQIEQLNAARRATEHQAACLDSENVALRTTVDMLARQLARATDRAKRPLG